MTSRRLFIGFVIFLLVSCNDVSPVPLSGFNEERLVVEGYLTDSVQTQRLSVGLVNDLGDSSAIGVSNLSLSLTQGTSVYTFYPASSTQMFSDIPFAGIADSTYIIDFCYNGQCYSKSFEMPSKVSIESFDIISTSNIQGYYIDAMYVTLSSNTDQFIRYEVYTNPYQEMFDSTWTLQAHPIYWTEQVTSGLASHFLNEFHNQHFYLSGASAVKIKIYSLATETGTYLEELREFMENDFAGSQYQNPPFYFDGEVYGLVYGTVEDSAIFVF